MYLLRKFILPIYDAFILREKSLKECNESKLKLIHV